MLHHHRGNRLEDLADALIAVESDGQGDGVSDPLKRITVVVPNPGVGRWLALRWAAQRGVCAHVEFLLPARFVWEAIRDLIPGPPDARAFEPDVLIWRILRHLDDVADAPGAGELRAWIDRADAWGRYDLAVRLAGVLDQYVVYRPDWISQWRDGRGEHSDHWQAVLWQRLEHEHPDTHWVAAQQAFRTALARGVAQAHSAAVHVFGVTALSPAYVDVIAGLAECRDVHLYLLHPCRQHWLDIEPEWRAEEPVAYTETGNALLASLGRQGRDLIALLLEREAVEHDHFIAPPEHTTLGRLQCDVLDLVNRGDDAQALPWPGDTTIQVHSCHGPAREIEVLHDRLLDMFASDTTLTPADVIVMTPDIETYTPYIEAVFTGAPPDRGIPFTIADRAARAESPLIDGFFALLELDPRITAEALLALLEVPALARRFDLRSDDLPVLRSLVRDSGIRWGIDSAHRERLGLPGIEQNTWRSGLERLLLGYAMGAGSERALIDGIAPSGDLEGEGALGLGRLIDFCEAVFALNDDNHVPRAIHRWCEDLSGVLARFFAPEGDEESELSRLQSALARLADDARAGDFGAAVPIEVVIAALQRALDSSGGMQSFLAGDVTFCGMVPMRSIPFRVVCLVGMNDDAFPRVQRMPGFDLMSGDFRIGDRSRRNDDRYLFLECLLAARERVYISYTGRTSRDNVARASSVLVSELLDFLDRGWVCEGGGALREHIVIQHPLHAFSRDNFGSDPRLFSYARELAQALDSTSRGDGASAKPIALFHSSLPEADAESRSVNLTSLIRFFGNPVRHLLRERLGVFLGSDSEPVPDDEIMAPEGLERYRLRTALVSRLAEYPGDEAQAWLRAAGVVPHAGPGEVWLAKYGREAQSMLAVRATCGAPVEPLTVGLEFDGFHIDGRLVDLCETGIVCVEAGSLNGARRLRVWLQHLLLNAVRPDRLAYGATLICVDRVVRFKPLEDAETARGLLESLLGLYWRGLHEPLHFFPESAYAFVSASRSNPLEAARNRWRGATMTRAEGAAPEYRLAFPEVEPIDDSFVTLAEQVYAPLLEHTAESAL